jgi:hypothetical protein
LPPDLPAAFFAGVPLRPSAEADISGVRLDVRFVP